MKQIPYKQHIINPKTKARYSCNLHIGVHVICHVYRYLIKIGSFFESEFYLVLFFIDVVKWHNCKKHNIELQMVSNTGYPCIKMRHLLLKKCQSVQFGEILLREGTFFLHKLFIHTMAVHFRPYILGRTFYSNQY